MGTPTRRRSHLTGRGTISPDGPAHTGQLESLRSQDGYRNGVGGQTQLRRMLRGGTGLPVLEERRRHLGGPGGLPFTRYWPRASRTTGIAEMTYQVR